MEHDLVAALRNQSQVLEKVKQQLRECQTREEELQQQLSGVVRTVVVKGCYEDKLDRAMEMQPGGKWDDDEDDDATEEEKD